MSTSRIKILRDALIRISTYERLILSARYSVEHGQYADYRGLCDIATEKAMDAIDRFYQSCYEQYGPDYCRWLFGNYDKDKSLQSHHGELVHNDSIPSTYWELQHTWLVFNVGYAKFYIDLTSQQFQWVNPGIPDYYVGTKPPWYLYDDRENPRWERKGIKGLLNRIAIIHGRKHKIKSTLIEFCQYVIWGNYCDLKRRIQRKKKPTPPW